MWEWWHFPTELQICKKVKEDQPWLLQTFGLRVKGLTLQTLRLMVKLVLELMVKFIGLLTWIKLLSL